MLVILCCLIILFKDFYGYKELLCMHNNENVHPVRYDRWLSYVWLHDLWPDVVTRVGGAFVHTVHAVHVCCQWVVLEDAWFGWITGLPLTYCIKAGWWFLDQKQICGFEHYFWPHQSVIAAPSLLCCFGANPATAGWRSMGEKSSLPSTKCVASSCASQILYNISPKWHSKVLDDIDE